MKPEMRARWAVLLCLCMAAGTVHAGDLLFIHHSVGQNWLDFSLRNALSAKTYVDQVNEITYGTALLPDTGRPASLGGVPGDSTDMNTWLLWFNDYVGQVKTHPNGSGLNTIIMFKSCFPNSDVASNGTEPGDPLGDLTLANLKAVYRHPSGAGHTYGANGQWYKPLGDVFAANPDTLFIPVTSPPLNNTSTDDAAAHRARLFNNWLQNEWLPAYKTAHPGLNNVAVFDLFNEIANADTATHPNRLKSAYGGATDDSHPNDAANAHLTAVFATGTNDFVDAAWDAFNGTAEGETPGEGEVTAEGEEEGEGETAAEGEGEGGIDGLLQGCMGTAATLGGGAPKPPSGGAGGDALVLLSAAALLLIVLRTGRTRTARP